MTSDPDRQSVYYAEALTFEETLFTDPLHTTEFMELANLLFHSPWWSSNSIPTPVIEAILGHRNEPRASYAEVYHPHSAYDEGLSYIRIAPDQIDVHTLAHEAAHVAQYHIFPIRLNPHIQSHGKEFRATYLMITSILLGYNACVSLADNFSRFIPDHSWLPYAGDLEDLAGGPGIYKQWCLARSLAALKDIKVTPTGRGPIAL